MASCSAPIPLIRLASVSRMAFHLTITRWKPASLPWTVMSKLFISHSTIDDDFVRRLREALAEHGGDGWIDSRELRGGEPLWPAIQSAIESAAVFAVVISPAAFQSRWVGQELVHALEQSRQSNTATFPVIPLLLDGTQLGLFEHLIGEEPLCIPVSSDAGGVEAAVHPILVALGRRQPHDVFTYGPRPRPNPSRWRNSSWNSPT